MPDPSHPDEILANILIGLESQPNFDCEAELARHPKLEADLRHRLNQLRAAGMLPHGPDGADFQKDLVALGIDDTVRLRPLQVAPAQSETDEFVVPRVFGGRYRVQGVVGRGGMGAVYAAEDLDFGREVALKLLLFRTESEPQSRLRLVRLLREARITGQLEHPGIVPVYDVGLTSDRHLYYTMKLVHGRSLRDLVRAHEQRELGIEAQFTIQRRVEIVLRVCDALAFAHARGVVHRDLTPNNVMVGRFGEVLVMDWGIAKLLDRVEEPVVTDESAGSSHSYGTTPGAFLGTPNFAAPEQARGDVHAIDMRTDVFGVGALLHYLLTGQPPYVGRNREEIEDLARQTRRSTTVPSSAFACPPRELVAVFLKAMAADQAQRYETIDALAEDLRAFAANESGTAWSETPWSWTRKFVRRRPAITVEMIAMLALVGLALFARGIRNDLNVATQKQRDRVQAEFLRILVAGGNSLLDQQPPSIEARQLGAFSNEQAESFLPILTEARKVLSDAGVPVDHGTYGIVAHLAGLRARDRSLGDLMLDGLLDWACRAEFSRLPSAHRWSNRTLRREVSPQWQMRYERLAATHSVPMRQAMQIVDLADALARDEVSLGFTLVWPAYQRWWNDGVAPADEIIDAALARASPRDLVRLSTLLILLQRSSSLSGSEKERLTPRASELLDKALDSDPALGSALFLRGFIADPSERNVAIQYYRESIVANPDFAMAWRNLCVSLRERGWQEKHMEDLHESARWADLALRRFRDSGNRRTFLHAHANTERYIDLPRALNEIYAMLAEFPDYAEGYTFLASCLKETKASKADIANACAKACMLAPEDGSCCVSYARALFDAGCLDESVPIWERAIASGSQLATCWSNLGITILNSTSGLERRRASFCLRKACDLAPDNLVFQENLGLELVFEGLQDEGLPILQSAIHERQSRIDAPGGAVATEENVRRLQFLEESVTRDLSLQDEGSTRALQSIKEEIEATLRWACGEE